MKHVFCLAIMFSLATSQSFSYSTDTLKEIAKLSGSTQAACAVITGISKKPSDEIQWMGGVSEEINNLMSYALMDYTFTTRIARVISRTNSKIPWQTAYNINGCRFLDSDFLAAFALSITREIAHEAKSYFREKGVTLALKNVTDNRIFARASQALAEAFLSSLVEVLFSQLDHSITKAPQRDGVFVSTFIKDLTTQIAYHAAGEIILRHATDTKSTGRLSDIFGSCK